MVEGDPMEQEDRRRAKLRVVDGLRHGLPCREALKLADVPISERTAYRALKVVRTVGEEGLGDGRHGRPYKLTAPIREWLVEYCRGEPGTPSRVVRAEIGERFGVTVSISQINRARRALGIGSRGVGGGIGRARSGARSRGWGISCSWPPLTRPA